MKINLINGGVSHPVDNLITARIREGLDTEYTLSFTLTEDDVPYIHDDTMVEYGGQYFHVVSYQKDREGQSPICSVECEHVSYSLNDEPYKLTEFVFSGSVSAALAAVLDGTPLSAGTVELSGDVNIRLTGGTRKAILISVAAIIGREIEYDGYTVCLRQHRGSVEYIDLLDTDNVTGVSVSRDVLYGTTTYHVQLGRKTTLSCGDNVHIRFTPLDIDAYTRITAIEYNPYNPFEVEIEVGDYVPDILDNLQKAQTKADTALKTATDTANSLSGYTKKSEVSGVVASYLESESGRASVVMAVSGTYATKSDLAGYVDKTELSAEIGAYIDTEAGTAKLVNSLSGTFVTENSLGEYVQKTELSTEINSYIDTQAGKAQIVSAVSGTYQKLDEMGNYLQKTELSAQIGAYIDTSTGKSKIVSAVSGTYQKKTDMGSYATVQSVSEISQSISDIESEITLSTSYSNDTIGTNVQALLQLVSNENSSNIKVKADKIDFTGFTTFLRESDLGEGGSTTIYGGRIDTDDLYLQSLRTKAGDYIISYYGNVLSMGGGTSSYGSYAEFDYIDMIVMDGIRFGYASSLDFGFFYESYDFNLRPTGGSRDLNIGTSSYPVNNVYCNSLYVNGKAANLANYITATGVTRIYEYQSTSYYLALDNAGFFRPGDTTEDYKLGAGNYPFQAAYIGEGSYYWSITRDGIIPSYNTSSYFDIGSSSYPVQNLYAKNIYLNGTALSSGVRTNYAGYNVYLGGNSNYYIVANTNRELRPSDDYYAFYLGTSGNWWNYAYIGSTAAYIGSGYNSRLSFFGATGSTRQTVSNSATVATLITALKAYGLIY